MLARSTCHIRNPVPLQFRFASTNLATKRFQPLASSSRSIDLGRWAVQDNDNNRNNDHRSNSWSRDASPGRRKKHPPPPSSARSPKSPPSVDYNNAKSRHFRPSNGAPNSFIDVPPPGSASAGGSQPDASSFYMPPSADPVLDASLLSERKELTLYPESDIDIIDENTKRYTTRSKYKTRSSLKQGGAIARPSRVVNTREEKQNKSNSKLKTPKLITYMQDVYIPPLIAVGHLSRLLDVSLESLQRKMIESGMENEVSFDHILNSDYASMLALEFQKTPIVDEEAAFDIFPPKPHPNPSTLPLRPPVVTVMGHVDHGKTTLLDTLRSSSVAKGEAGGITQHIGAFSVPVITNAKSSCDSITFLDTPGHSAFTAMRARGVRVTDIVVLVVAADDGVMPQTKEVIDLIKKDEKLGVIVAVNKMDKPGVNPDNITKSLLAEGLQLECFDGHIPVVEVSGLTGQGLDQLVENLSLMAELAELRAEKSGTVHGYILESKILKGLGPVATVLVLRGELTVGSNLISGVTHARVRQLMDFNGEIVKSAHPGMAVTVAGWKEFPSAGDEVLQGSETDIRKAIINRRRRIEQVVMGQDAEAINERRRLARIKREALTETSEVIEATEDLVQTIKQLRLVIKCDVSGTVEAVVGALEGIGNNLAHAKIVHSSVGDVTESDVMMAQAIGGAIVAFSVSVPRAIRTLAAANDIPIISSDIIYRLMEDVKAEVIALLPPIIETRVVAEATVAQLFDIHLKRKEIMKVAGCKVTNGLLEKNKAVRVIRAGTIIHDHDTLQTLRHHKRDMQEIRKDMECGLSLTNFGDLQPGDIIQSIQTVQKPGVL